MGLTPKIEGNIFCIQIGANTYISHELTGRLSFHGKQVQLFTSTIFFRDIKKAQFQLNL